MKTFEYIITDPVGLHARPAGSLVRKVKEYADHTVMISKGEKNVNALRLMALMQLGIRQGDTVTVSVEGDNEEETSQDLERFFRENL